MKNRYFIYGIFFMGLISILGCGDGGSSSPSKSTMTINPATVSVTDGSGTVSTHSQSFTITVLDSNGKPMNEQEITISFPWAVPDSAGVVQLYDGNTPVNSPFKAETDKFGVYNLRFDYQTGGGLAYKGDIEVRSATVYAKASVEVK